MADNYADRLTADEALDLIRLAFEMRATCTEYAIVQPTKKLTNWRHRILLDMGHARLPTEATLAEIAAALGLPSKVVGRWAASYPAAIAGRQSVES